MKLSFKGSIAPLMSAILIDGIDGNARVKIDIPGSEREAISKLSMFSQKVLNVTIEVEEEQAVEKEENRTWRKDD